MKNKILSIIQRDIKKLSMGKPPLTMTQLKSLLNIKNITPQFLHQNVFADIDIKENLIPILRVLSEIKNLSISDQMILNDTLRLRGPHDEVPASIADFVVYGLSEMYLRPYIETHAGFLRAENRFNTVDFESKSITVKLTYLSKVIEKYGDLDLARDQSRISEKECLLALEILETMKSSALATVFPKVFELALRNPENIQLKAIQVLGKVGGPHSLAALILLLNSKDDQVLLKAVSALAEKEITQLFLDNKNLKQSIVNKLRKLCNHENPHLGFESANTLETIGYFNKKEAELLRRLIGGDYTYPRIKEVLEKKEEVIRFVRPVLMRYLKSDQLQHQNAVVRIIINLGLDASVLIGDLYELLSTSDSDNFSFHTRIHELIQSILPISSE